MKRAHDGSNSQGNNQNNRSSSQGNNHNNRSNSQGNNSNNHSSSQGNNPNNRSNSQGNNSNNRSSSQGNNPINRSNSQGNHPNYRSNSQGNNPNNRSSSQGNNPNNRSNSQGNNPNNRSSSQGNNPNNRSNSQGNNSHYGSNSQGNNSTYGSNSQGNNPNCNFSNNRRHPQGRGGNTVRQPPPPPPPSASSHNHNTTPATSSKLLLPTKSSKSQQVSGTSLGQTQNPMQISQDFWLQCIKEWYPDRDQKTYFLPPQFFRRKHHEVVTMSGLSVLVHKPTPKVPKPGPAPFYPSLRSQTQSGSNQFKPAQTSINLPTSSQSNRIQPTPTVAGSIFTIPEGHPAPLPRYIETDNVDDDATERLLGCLRLLSEKHHEVMMVISQLEFRKYLDNDTDPINAAKNAAACSNLPRPVTMQQQQHHDGDFDVLIIHRHYGLMVCEVKAVGADRRDTPDLTKAVVDKVQKAVKQLNKAKTVLNHLVSDMVPVQVTKTLVLPNVTSAELMQALSTAPQLEKDLCTCLDAKDLPEAITRCLCADQIPSVADLQALCNQGDNPGQTSQPTSGASTSSSQTSTSPSQTNQFTSGASASSSQTSASSTFPLLSSWWQNMTSQGAGPDPQMSEPVYDNLLARFCGPATTVEVPTVTAPRKAMAKPGKFTPARKVVRTQGEAVAETGLIHSLLALYPDQVDLLGDNTLRCVHLFGPPGTGKTVVLVLKAIQWLHQGHDVHVVSKTNEGRAVSILIERQLQCVLGPNPAPCFGKVHRHVLNATDYYTDVCNLAALASDGELYVIADEIASSKGYSPTFHFEQFINELHTKVPCLSVWCASVQKLDRPPSLMCERQLTTPLRCPPAVTKEVAKSKEMKGSTIPAYSSTPAPAATEGPPVRWLPHKGDQDGHTKGTSMNCDACGDAVVQLLKEFGVGQSSGPESLQYRDVLVLGPSERVKSKGKVSKRADKGITGKLRASGIPVTILTSDSDDAEIHDAALALKNEVTVTDFVTVSGLERRVVIGTGTSVEQSFLKNRLLAMSRCTAQLAWIGDVTQT